MNLILMQREIKELKAKEVKSEADITALKVDVTKIKADIKKVQK